MRNNRRRFGEHHSRLRESGLFRVRACEHLHRARCRNHGTARLDEHAFKNDVALGLRHSNQHCDFSCAQHHFLRRKCGQRMGKRNHRGIFGMGSAPPCLLCARPILHRFPGQSDNARCAFRMHKGVPLRKTKIAEDSQKHSARFDFDFSFALCP